MRLRYVMMLCGAAIFAMGCARSVKLKVAPTCPPKLEMRYRSGGIPISKLWFDGPFVYVRQLDVYDEEGVAWSLKFQPDLKVYSGQKVRVTPFDEHSDLGVTTRVRGPIPGAKYYCYWMHGDPQRGREPKSDPWNDPLPIVMTWCETPGDAKR